MEADSRARLLSCCPHASCVRVPSTFIGKDGATVYLLEITWWPPLQSDGENEGLSWTLSKRFREFDALSAELALYGSVPALPPKQMFGNRKPSVIEARRVGVEAFLTHCISTPAISNNEVFARFLEVEQHCEPSACPYASLAVEIPMRRVRDTGSMLGVTCFHYCLQEDVLLVTSEDQSLLSRVDSRLSNLKAKPTEELPIGGLLCYKYFSEEEGYELVAQESYQDKATALAFDQERRYVFVGLSSGHVLLYYADVQWALSAPLADIVCHSLRVSQLCLASDGLLLSISKDRTLRAIDTSVDQPCSVFHAALPTKHWPLALAWNPRQNLAYVSTLGGEILGIEVTRQEESDHELKEVQAAVVLKAHRGRVQAIFFASPEKHLFSGGESGAAGVWNLQHGEARFCGMLQRGPSCAVTCIFYLRPFKLVATGYANGMIGLWDARGGHLFHIFRAHTASSSSPNATVLARRSSISMSNPDSVSSSPSSSPQPPLSPIALHSRSNASSSPRNFSSGSGLHSSPVRRNEIHDGTSMAVATPFSWAAAPPLIFDELPSSPSSGKASSPTPSVVRRITKPSSSLKSLRHLTASSPISATSVFEAVAEAAAAARLEPLSLGSEALIDGKQNEGLSATSGTSSSAASLHFYSSSPQFPRSISQPTLHSSFVPLSSSLAHAPTLWASASSAPSVVAPSSAPKLHVSGTEVRWLWFDELTYTLVSCSDQEIRFWSFPSNYCHPLQAASVAGALVCPPKLPAFKFPVSLFSSPISSQPASLLSSESVVAPGNLFAEQPSQTHAARLAALSITSHTSSNHISQVSSETSASGFTSEMTVSSSLLDSSPNSSPPSTQVSSRGSSSSQASATDASSSESVNTAGNSGSETGDSKAELRRCASESSSWSGESGSYERINSSWRCSHGREFCNCSRNREKVARGPAEPCARCALSVFPSNRVEVLGVAYHSWCVRCCRCATVLTFPFQGFLCAAHQSPLNSPLISAVFHCRDRDA